MTRARITAAQATRPPKGMRMHRGTVTAVSPLTVQIAGGGAVTGLAVPGQRYTVGDAVLVAVQEPAVGPVYPLAPTAPPDLTPYAKTTDLAAYVKTTAITSATGTLTYSGTFADFGSGRTSSVTRYGTLATLNLQATVGATAPTAGAVVATLPTGHRPAALLNWTAVLFSGGWSGNSVVLEIGTDGRVIFQAATLTPPASSAFFGAVTYAAA